MNKKRTKPHKVKKFEQSQNVNINFHLPYRQFVATFFVSLKNFLFWKALHCPVATIVSVQMAGDNCTVHWLGGAINNLSCRLVVKSPLFATRSRDFP